MKDGLTDRIAETPYLTLFPASLEDPEIAGPPRVHRFREPAADAAGARRCRTGAPGIVARSSTPPSEA